VLDNIELAELVRVCGIEYVIIRGYYWTAQQDDSLTSLTSNNNCDTDSQGGSQTNPFEVDNGLVKKFIMQHYEAKQRATTELERNTEKLILSSVFGKCIQKGYKTTTRKAFRTSITKVGKLVTKDEKYNRYKLRKHNMIQKFDDDALEVTLFNGYDGIFDKVNVGVAVLSESKRLMNQLFDYCEANGIIVVYSAVDSILVESSKLELLRPLISETIGQLKIVASGKPILIGKGTYYLSDEHYRCFGIPHKSI
jgi:hypothetical protein